MKKWAVSFFVKPFVPAVLAGIAPLLGAFIALRKDQIAPLFNSQISVPSNAILEGWGDLIISVFLIVGLILGFALHKWAEAIKGQERLAELKTHTESLQEYLKTLPPQGFLEKYREFYERSYKDITSGLTSSTDVKNSIEVGLLNLALLASYFDDQRVPTQYSINFMVFERFPILPLPEGKTRTEELLRNADFIEAHPSEAALAGVLTLNTELSLTMDQEKKVTKPDKDVSQLILPIPKENLRFDEKRRSTVLPGAPAAFCENKAQFCVDTAGLGKSMSATGLRPEIPDKIDQYFRKNGATIKSFISLPMTIPFANDGAKGIEQIGVVNIHSNKPDMLRGVEGAQLFIPLTTPYCVFLAQLIKKVGLPAIIPKTP